MKHLIYITSILILVSCSETKRFSKWKDRGEKHGWSKDSIHVKTDTFVKVVVRVDSFIIIKHDTIHIQDSALRKSDKDTFSVNSKGITGHIIVNWKDSTAKWDFKRVNTNTTKTVNKTTDSTTNINKETEKSQAVTPPPTKCPEDKFQWSAFWKGFGCCAVLGFITFLILKFK